LTIFSDLLEKPKNELVAQAIEQGAIPIGYTCSYVPEVMLSVDKLLPLRIRAPGVSGTDSIEMYLPPTSCSYVRSILNFAVDGKYDFLKGWVFVASCDHLRRLYDYMDYLVKPEFNHILDVPHKKTPLAIPWLVDRFEDLRKDLSEHFDVIIDDRSLKASISEYNEMIELLQSIGDLRKDPNPPFTGTEFHQMMLAVITTPAKMIVDSVRKFKEEIVVREKQPVSRARLMVIGGQLNDPRFLEIIESQGGLIVADRVCTGSIPGLVKIDENKEPIIAIAEHTMAKTDCPRMMDFDGRLQRILDSVKEYNVDGVIVETIKFCDIWSVEASELVKCLRERSIRVLRIEREYRLTNEGQLRTRVQAFLESMGNTST
jgi:benzoyl-CoA reductase/2-hydroxyglutaryl-CoA dehydratase subunit BcrC/BadD/HgdB